MCIYQPSLYLPHSLFRVQATERARTYFFLNHLSKNTFAKQAKERTLCIRIRFSAVVHITACAPHWVFPRSFLFSSYEYVSCESLIAIFSRRLDHISYAQQIILIWLILSGTHTDCSFTTEASLLSFVWKICIIINSTVWKILRLTCKTHYVRTFI